MIKIEVKKENNQIKEILIKGHANYDISGKDIVCAAASAITITTINAILSIDSEAIYYEEEPNLFIKINKFDDVTNKLIKNMINMLKELEHDYPKNIKIL